MQLLDDSKLDQDKAKGNVMETVFSFIGGTFSPVIPVQTIGYNANIFPVILGVLLMSVIYKYLQKTLPTFMRTIFVPLITMLITVPVTFVVLGPIGNTVGTWLANGVLAIYRAAPPIAVMVIGTLTCWMVFFGMNNATYPILFLLIAEVGSDPLICTGMAPANVAVGGGWYNFGVSIGVMILAVAIAFVITYILGKRMEGKQGT